MVYFLPLLLKQVEQLHRLIATVAGGMPHGVIAQKVCAGNARAPCQWIGVHPAACVRYFRHTCPTSYARRSGMIDTRAAVPVSLCTACRSQSVLGEPRMTAHYSKAAYKHPLAPTDPASRNVAIPDSAHTRIQSKDSTQPAAVLHKKAQRALLLQMQQEVLWEGTVLDDVHHKLIEHFIKLGRNPKFRAARNLMTVGGKEMIRELCARGQVPHHLLITEGNEVPAWARRQRGMEIVPVKDYIAQACCPEGNDGYVGDFDIPTPPDKERLIANQLRLQRVLVLDNVDDAGLLGTLMRTAAGLHYDAVITTNHCADMYDHHVVRAARGAHFQPAVPFYTLRDEDGDDVYGMLNHVIRRNGLKPVCYAAKNDASSEESQHPSNNATRDGDVHDCDEGTLTKRHGFHFASEDGSPSKGTSGDGVVFHSSVVGARPIRLPALRDLPAYATGIAAQMGTAPPCTMRLTDFCVDHFAPKADALCSRTNDPGSSIDRPRSSSHDRYRDGSYDNDDDDDDYTANAKVESSAEEMRRRSPGRHSTYDQSMASAPSGLMVFIGPNHKQTMLKRLHRSVSQPVTQLLLDADVPADTDALIAFSVVLHALRPGGEQDYLPIHSANEPKRTNEPVQRSSTSTNMCATASVDIGPNRLSVSEDDINWDEAEQEREAHLANEFAKWKRLNRRKKSDYAYWTDAEEARIRAMAREERRQREKPWMSSSSSSRRNASQAKRSTRVPDWVPNIIDEYRQPLDRDRLVQEQARSTEYVRPRNYDR